MSAAAAASAGVATTRPAISLASGRQRSSVRLWRTTSAPALPKARAIALPIRPVPTIATVVMADLPGLLETDTDRVHDPLDGRDRRVFEDGGGRQRHVRRRDSDEGRVQAVEALVSDDRDDLGAPAKSAGVLLDREQSARLRDRSQNRLSV